MILLINRLQAKINRDNGLVGTYSTMIESILEVRNMYLNKKKLQIINDTIFSDFIIVCMGSTMTYARESRLRILDKFAKKKRTFRYNPETDREKDLDGVLNYNFRNRSGNKINSSGGKMFKITDGQINIIEKNSTRDQEYEGVDGDTKEKTLISRLPTKTVTTDEDEIDISDGSEEENTNTPDYSGTEYTTDDDDQVDSF
jgi:hypothetical protein